MIDKQFDSNDIWITLFMTIYRFTFYMYISHIPQYSFINNLQKRNSNSFSTKKKPGCYEPKKAFREAISK